MIKTELVPVNVGCHGKAAGMGKWEAGARTGERMPWGGDGQCWRKGEGEGGGGSVGAGEWVIGA